MCDCCVVISVTNRGLSGLKFPSLLSAPSFSQLNSLWPSSWSSSPEECCSHPTARLNQWHQPFGLDSPASSQPTSPYLGIPSRKILCQTARSLAGIQVSHFLGLPAVHRSNNFHDICLAQFNLSKSMVGVLSHFPVLHVPGNLFPGSEMKVINLLFPDWIILRLFWSVDKCWSLIPSTSRLNGSDRSDIHLFSLITQCEKQNHYLDC